MAAPAGSRHGRDRGPESRETQISKTLSWLLRHGAQSSGLSMAADGYALVSDVMALSKLKQKKCTLHDIQQVVANCNKQRFSLKQEGAEWYVRANQGHSLAIVSTEALLKKIEDPSAYAYCVHGTYSSAWPAIVASGGLSKMGRNHIHFSSQDFGSKEIISGMRATCDILVYINLPAAIKDDYEFFVSDNEVILTQGDPKGFLPLKYFGKVINRKTGEVLAGSNDFQLIVNPSAVAALKAARPAPSAAPVKVAGPRTAKAGEAAEAEDEQKMEVSGSKRQPSAQQSAKTAAKLAARAAAKASSLEQAAGVCGPLKYLCVLDFEATCDEDRSFGPSEIIELPTVVVDIAQRKVIGAYHTYIKPSVHPNLTKFCTELTGITQQMVDEAVEVIPAFIGLHKFLTELKLIDDKDQPVNMCFLTCGDWDLKTMLPKQLSLINKPIPAYFNQWINIKFAFQDQYQTQARGMAQMLEILKIKLAGRHHSGIDDAKNIASIAIKMIEDGWTFKPTTTFASKKQEGELKK